MTGFRSRGEQVNAGITQAAEAELSAVLIGCLGRDDYLSDTVRAHNLRDALLSAAALPTTEWFDCEGGE